MAGGEVKLISLDQAFGEFTAVDGIDLRDARRRVLLDARPVGLRQDDDAAHDRRLRAADARARSCWTARTWPTRRRTAARQHGVPELRALPAPDRVRQRRLRPAPPEDAEARSQARASDEALELVQMDRLREAQAGPALRRPAAARRAGPRPGAEAGGAAAGRAARRPRREAAQAAADRAEGAPAAGRHHVHLRDARPGRGADDERPHRRDERTAGSSRWRRRRRSTRSRRPRSWPTSSACPT